MKNAQSNKNKSSGANTSRKSAKGIASKLAGSATTGLGFGTKNSIFSTRSLKEMFNMKGGRGAKKIGKAVPAVLLGQAALVVGGAYIVWTQRHKIMNLLESSGVSEFFTTQFDKLKGEENIFGKGSTDSSISTESSRSRAV